ncbi:MAG: MaoC family dehydratase [Rhodospirillaceae bacterium]|nr:MaoC family dehydratase [Rhodospirillaceae bacterium]MDD9913190.1 MaoC family dehydratase [Rhodospirillaceae bacterium]MDD9930052.1 MaoC family dehydratase [Rhodospirillaceae bacterium]
MHTKYLEDFEPGQIFRTRGMSMDESEIMDFARKYDPQPIHTDREAAAEGPFEGLIASGWHTGSMVFRLWVDLGFMEKSSLGGPGIENLRWLVPVRPGDTLHTEVEIIEARPSKSKPDRGILRYITRGINQRGETVITMDSASFLKRRPENAE